MAAGAIPRNPSAAASPARNSATCALSCVIRALDSTSWTWRTPFDGDNLLKADGRGIFVNDQLMDEARFADDGRELHMRKALRVPER